MLTAWPSKFLHYEGVVARMSGTSAGMCHFGVAEVALCAWADGNTTISFPESALPARSAGQSNAD